MSNKELVQAALEELKRAQFNYSDWLAYNYEPLAKRFGTPWGKALAILNEIEDVPETPIDLDVPTDLALVSVGNWNTTHTTHDESGRSAYVTGLGPAGRRVNLYSKTSIVGGDAIKPDGTWGLNTILLPEGTAEITASSINADGTDESARSEPLAVVIPRP